MENTLYTSVDQSNRVDIEGLEAYEIDNFLEKEECGKLVEMINKNKCKSTVATYEKPDGETSEERTSSTSILDDSDSFIKHIDKKISESLGIGIEFGEGIQGQVYEVGEEFKNHTDYFTGEAYDVNCKGIGNRTWTFMIYLNDDGLEGGETEFPRVDKSFIPSAGKAVVWRNMNKDGTVNDRALHAGKPVKKGNKYIITKWFREHPYQEHKEETIRKNTRITPRLSPSVKAHRNMTPVTNTFSTVEDLPKLTGTGFEKIKVPRETWSLISEIYYLLKSKGREEKWDYIEDVIHDAEGKCEGIVDMLSLDLCPTVRDIIHNSLHPVVEEWCGASVTPYCMYGIRSYKDGAQLSMHRDRIETHHQSLIIVVDKKVTEDWPLHVIDHQGTPHDIYAEPGEMILYESAVLEHGRPETFRGEYFRNMFAHYTLNNWTYTG